MKKTKAFKTALISLGLATALTASGAVMLMTNGTSAAYAADRYVELDGNSVFYTSIRGAEINASEEIGEGESAVRYTQFKIGEGQKVEYRQNLAYSWTEGGKVTSGDDEGKFDGSHTDKNFSMSVSFADLNFKRYVIKFQSQQNVATKDEKTEHYVIFTPAADGEKISVAVAKTLEEEDGNIKGGTQNAGTYDKDAVISIRFMYYDSGNYTVYFSGNNGGVDNTNTGVVFENVYRQYATYVASGDAAVTPLTFSAEFNDGDTEKAAEMLLHEINGQSFAMYEQSGVYKVKDTAAPVMCFTQTPSYLQYGKSIGMQYRVIDVLAASPRTTSYYYVLSGDQYKSETFDFDKIYYDAEDKKDETDGEEGEEGGETKKEENPFIQISSSSSARIIRDEKTFIPYDMIDSNVYGLVKLYFEISDVNGSSAQTDIIFPAWCAKEEALVDIYDYKKGESGAHSYFLKLIDDKEGATYAQAGNLTAGDAEAAYRQSVKDFEEAYQAKITEAIAKLDDGKLYAGSDKFYLPSIESLDGWTFFDDYFIATDYKYSIYYRAKTSGSKSSLDFNKLAIDLPEADVTYRFTIYITDAFGNPMRYPVTNDDGEIEWKEIETGDIWDDDFAGLLPFFEVDVSYKEATAENPENLSLAYVGTNYSGVSFDIKGVSGTYTSQYKLYVFDRNAFNKDIGENLDYNAFSESLQKLFNNTYIEGVNTRKYFTTVKAASNLLESDVNYEEHKALNWSDSSVSFTPQSVDDFYVIELCLKDNRSQTQTLNYATVAASVQTTALKGESDWAKNNIASIVLLTIAGVCLIALIALLVIKPKDKGDIDAIYSEVTEKQKPKAEKKSN